RRAPRENHRLRTVGRGALLGALLPGGRSEERHAPSRGDAVDPHGRASAPGPPGATAADRGVSDAARARGSSRPTPGAGPSGGSPGSGNFDGSPDGRRREDAVKPRIVPRAGGTASAWRGAARWSAGPQMRAARTGMARVWVLALSVGLMGTAGAGPSEAPT